MYITVSVNYMYLYNYVRMYRVILPVSLSYSMVQILEVDLEPPWLTWATSIKTALKVHYIYKHEISVGFNYLLLYTHVPIPNLRVNHPIACSGRPTNL